MKLLKKLASVAAILTLVVAGITNVNKSTDSSLALNGSMFDPGLIISDSVFYDFGTMTVKDIQRFLDSRVPNCNASPTSPGCLKDFTMDIPATPASEGRCSAIEARTKASAAQAIYDVARACGINPRVILVTLQKEQGLVTSTNPTEYKYRAAMGMSCPDSNPAQCGKVDGGFFQQPQPLRGRGSHGPGHQDPPPRRPQTR